MDDMGIREGMASRIQMKDCAIRMTMEEYLKAPGLSGSILCGFERSPAHFKALLEEKEETRATVFGSVFHPAILEPLLLSYYVRPETYPSTGGAEKAWNGNANWCKDWLESHRDKPVITAAEEKDLCGMRDSVWSHPVLSMILGEGDAEVCLFAKDPKTGLQLKCRSDWMSGNVILDLKTTEDARPWAFSRSIAKFGYDVQAAMNLKISRLLALNKRYFVFGVIEKSPPYAIKLYELDEESIALGEEKIDRWLATYSFCKAQGSWPAYDEKMERIALPQWAAREGREQLLLE